MTTRADRDHRIERRSVDRSRVFRSKTRTFTMFSTRESNVTAGEVQRSHLCGRVSRSALINRRVDYWNRPRDLPSVSEVLSQLPGNLLLHAGEFWLKLGEFLRASVRYLMWRGREQEREWNQVAGHQRRKESLPGCHAHAPKPTAWRTPWSNRKNWRTGEREMGSGPPVGMCRRLYLKFSSTGPTKDGGLRTARQEPKVPEEIRGVDVGLPAMRSKRRQASSQRETEKAGFHGRVAFLRGSGPERESGLRTTSPLLVMLPANSGLCFHAAQQWKHQRPSSFQRSRILRRANRVKSWAIEQKFSHNVIRWC